MDNLQDLIRQASDKHQVLFLCSPTDCGYGSGRINLIGDHTDYNDGESGSLVQVPSVCCIRHISYSSVFYLCKVQLLDLVILRNDFRCDDQINFFLHTGLVFPMAVPLHSVVVGSLSTGDLTTVCTLCSDAASSEPISFHLENLKPGEPSCKSFDADGRVVRLTDSLCRGKLPEGSHRQFSDSSEEFQLCYCYKHSNWLWSFQLCRSGSCCFPIPRITAGGCVGHEPDRESENLPEGGT